MPPASARPARPLVLGLNRTQDASLCLMSEGEVLVSLQKERLTRQKHHWGALGDLRLYRGRLAQLAQPIDLVVESYSSDAEIARRPEYRREIEECLDFRGEPRVLLVSHHLAHAYTAFHPSRLERAAVMVADFMGSPVEHLTEDWPARAAALPGQVEVSSFYVCGRGRDVACIGKQLWDRDRSRPQGLGCFYYFLTQAIFPGEGNEGKVMGLAAHARPDELGLPPLEVAGCEVHIPPAWFEVLGDRERFGHFSRGTGSFQDCARLAAAGQRAFEEALLALAGWLHASTGLDALCFAGGTALNCVANSLLARRSPFAEVFIPPAPHDGGTALGAALYGLARGMEVEPTFRWTVDFLGPEPDLGGLEEELAAADDLEWSRTDDPDELIGRMVQLLTECRVVALFQGRSELGPRALGHRSILADPRCAGMQDWINSRVKGREWFRPLAPMVRLEEVSAYFEWQGPSPWMLHSAGVRPERRAEIPAVVHADGSARLQTVAREDDALVYRLLSAFHDATGCGVLLNTSLNGKNQPLVETPAEALQCLRTTGLHALAIPPFLVVKKEPGERPGEGAGRSGTAC